MTEPQKAAKGNWDEDYKEDNSENKEPSGGNKEFRKARYMNMSKPGKYVVRLVGDHVNFRKHFKPYNAKVQDGEKDIDPAWQAGWFPAAKSAVNVINKTEVWDFDKKCATGVGTLEILEKGPSVFKHFANYKSVNDVIPSGKNGPDFIIEVKIPKDENGEYIRLKTEYLVGAIAKPAPFTEEEKAMVKADGGLFPLQDIYRSTPAEKMQEMWDALTDEQKKAPKREWDDDKKSDAPKAEAKAPEKMEEKMEDSPADAGDDLFDGGDAEPDDGAKDDSTELF
jgi:hypothetical protein